MMIMSSRNTIIIMISILINILVISCSTNTDSISPEEWIFLSAFYGEYKLTQTGADLLNNEYFLTPPIPNYSTQNIFNANNLGFIAIYTGQKTVSFQLQYVLNNNTSAGIFKIISPQTNQSGSLIQENRYLKISLDINTNLIFSSQYALTASSARDLISDTLFATRF